MFTGNMLPPITISDASSSCITAAVADDRRPENINIVKGQWSPQEDSLLLQSVNEYGLQKWSQIAKMIPGRTGKQCRDRWSNHLRPNIKKEEWSEEEEMTLIEAYKEVGSKWSKIAKKLPERTENTIKNHWNTTARRVGKYKRRSNRTPTLLENYIRNNLLVPNNNIDHRHIKDGHVYETNDDDGNFYPKSHRCLTISDLVESG